MFYIIVAFEFNVRKILVLEKEHLHYTAVYSHLGNVKSEVTSMEVPSVFFGVTVG